MFVQQGALKQPTITGGAATVVYDSTPAYGDLMIVASQGTTNPDAGTTGFVLLQQVTNALTFYTKIATASETNSYPFGGTTALSGTGSAFYGAVFRTTGGVVRSVASPLATQGQLATSPGTGTTPVTVDPAGITDRPSVILFSVMHSGTATTGATITWNGGGSTTPATATGRGGFDFIALSTIPADVKVVWSIGSAATIIGFAEMQGPGFM